MPQTIGLVAAMPEEIKPLLKKAGNFTRESCNGFSLYRFSLADRQICLIESGMGAQHATAATNALLEMCSPGIIINFGFAGAVTGGLAVGEIIVANRIADFTDGRPDYRHGILAYYEEKTLALLHARNTYIRYRSVPATFITSQLILNKRELADRLPQETGEYALDMETTAVAQAARSAGIPMLAIRAVSDGAEEELGFSIDEFTDETLTIRPRRVLVTVLKKPWIIPQLMRLAGNVKKAGNNLADALIMLLKELPLQG